VVSIAQEQNDVMNMTCHFNNLTFLQDFFMSERCFFRVPILILSRDQYVLTELIFVFFIGIRSSRFNRCPYQDHTHADLSPALFLHFLTLIDFRTFSIQSTRILVFLIFNLNKHYYKVIYDFCTVFCDTITQCK
jgi:hypothetical protein